VHVHLFLTFLLLFGSVVPSFCQTEQVFAFENPFYEDCRLVDQSTHQYVKANDIRYVKKTIKVGKSTSSIIEHFYNERAVLDSVREHYGNQVKRITSYVYDSSSRLTSKIDSFVTANVPDSLHMFNWVYNSGDTLNTLQRGHTYFDRPGFKYVHCTFFPQIVYDTLIGDMIRYKLVGPLMNLDGGFSALDNPVYYWIRDGKLVLSGSDTAYVSIRISGHDDGYEIRYHEFKGNFSTLMRINTFNAQWQLQASKVFFKGEWALLEDHRYHANGYEIMNTKYDPVNGIQTVTTFIRDMSNGKIEKEFSPITTDTKNGLPPSVSVTEVEYSFFKNYE
jgi:hypothetical protein